MAACRPGRMPNRRAGGCGRRSGEVIEWVAEFDIVGFFDNLTHHRLLGELAKVLDDPEIGLVTR